MNEQRHDSSRFSLDRSKKTQSTFANGTRQQSEGEVNGGGRTGKCKINCLNTTRVPILLSVRSLSQMGAIIDFSTGAAFFRHLADQAFVHPERASNGHLYLSLVEDVLSQPISNKEQLQGFQAAAQVLEKSREIRRKITVVLQHPLNIISYVTFASTTNKIQHFHHSQEPPHQILIHDSTWVQCSITQQFSHLCQ